MEYEIKKVTVRPKKKCGNVLFEDGDFKNRKLKVKWTVDMAEELKTIHSFETEEIPTVVYGDDLIERLSKQLVESIDEEILNQLLGEFNGNVT